MTPQELIAAYARMIIEPWIHNRNQRKHAKAAIELRLKQYGAELMKDFDPKAFTEMVESSDAVRVRATELLDFLVEKHGIEHPGEWTCEHHRALAEALRFNNYYKVEEEPEEEPEAPEKQSTDGQRNSEVGVNPVAKPEEDTPLLDVSDGPEVLEVDDETA